MKRAPKGKKTVVLCSGCGYAQRFKWGRANIFCQHCGEEMEEAIVDRDYKAYCISKPSGFFAG